MHQVIEFYEQNLQLARELGDRRGEMSALGSLGRAYDALNEHEKAIECYELALKLARELGDARSERQALRCLTDAQVGSGERQPSGEQTPSARKPSGKQKSPSAATERMPVTPKSADKLTPRRRPGTPARKRRRGKATGDK